MQPGWLLRCGTPAPRFCTGLALCPPAAGSRQIVRAVPVRGWGLGAFEAGVPETGAIAPDGGKPCAGPQGECRRTFGQGFPPAVRWEELPRASI